MQWTFQEYMAQPEWFVSELLEFFIEASGNIKKKK